MTKKISVIGMVTGILYFIAVGLFLLTQTEISLTVWELLTVISAPVVLFILLELSNLLHISAIFKNAMLAFMSCACALTGVAHIVNVTVTRRLISEGIDVPNFFRIGYWPSVEMAVDYLAWGFFVGLAFLCVGLSAHSSEQQKIRMKRLVIVCGILCLIGFLGAIMINENIWYVAPMGYGFGTIIICLQMMKLDAKGGE
ncbi:MAG TPA: hypothetical protein VJZ01_13215 [Lachnospiraceae bacterium]|nr:hypothetical protein [Lachnospiraceae bacterium]